MATEEGMAGRSVQTSSTANVVIDGSFAAPKTVSLADLSTPEVWSAAFAEGMALRLNASHGTSPVRPRMKTALRRWT